MQPKTIWCSGRVVDAPLPQLPAYGGTGVLPGVDLASNAALRDVMDVGEAVDALR